MRLLLALLFSVLTLPVFAGPAFAADGITFDHTATIGMPAALPTAGLYMYITNTGADDAIVSVSTPLSKTAILSTGKLNDKNTIVTEAVKSIAVPGGGKTTILNPAGDHIMVRDVDKILAVGTKIPVTLLFEKAGEKTIDVNVLDMNEFMKLFPAETMGDTLEKLREAKEVADNSGKSKNWAAKMRERIRALGGKGGPLDLETPIETPTPMEMGRSLPEPPVVNTDPVPSPVPPKGAIVEGPMSVPADAIPTDPGMTPEEFLKEHPPEKPLL
jgi:periplasmic copper chaperone A